MANAQASLRWLNREQPDLDQARRAAERIVKDEVHAAAIIDRLPTSMPFRFIRTWAVVEIEATSGGEILHIDVMETGFPGVVPCVHGS